MLTTNYKNFGGNESVRPIPIRIRLLILEDVLPSIDWVVISHWKAFYVDQLMYILFEWRPDTRLKKAELTSAGIMDPS